MHRRPRVSEKHSTSSEVWSVISTDVNAPPAGWVSAGDGRTDEVESLSVVKDTVGLAAARRGNHGAGRNEDVVVLRNGEGELHSRVAAVGGRSVSPRKSRNLIQCSSGTLFSRKTNWSTM